MLPKYKDIAELVKKGATVEAQEKIMELREAALELQEENFDLKARIKELEKQLAEEEALEYKAPFYWRSTDDKKDGPFCQQCYDSNNKKIRLQVSSNDYWTCSTCGNGYEGPNYKEPDVTLNFDSPFSGY